MLDNAFVEKVPNILRRSMDIQLFRKGGYHYGKLMMAFVTFANEQNAMDSSLRLNGQMVDVLTIWRPLVVEPAAPRLSYINKYVCINIHI